LHPDRRWSGIIGVRVSLRLVSRLFLLNPNSGVRSTKVEETVCVSRQKRRDGDIYLLQLFLLTLEVDNFLNLL
jgi:hypothetical protein